MCREEVNTFPGYIHKRLAPLMGLIKGDSQQSQQQLEGKHYS